MNSSHIVPLDNIIAQNSNSYYTTLITLIDFFNEFCRFSLSLIWFFYIVYHMLNDERILKKAKKSKNIMCELEFNNILENSYIRQIKSKFFLIICLSECGISLSMLANILISNTSHKNDPKFHNFRNSFYNSLFSISRRIAVILLSTSLYSIIACVRLLTEFLCCKYNHYKTKPYLCIRISLSFCVVPVLMLIGIFRQLFLFSFIGIVLALIYQFIQLCFAVRKLKRLLYKRLFDAQYLECQPPHVVNYFRRAHWNFKYASIILVVVLFLQTLGYSMLYTYSIITTIVYLPHTWLNTILYGTEEQFRHFSFADNSNNAITDLVYVIITVGTSLHVIPYIMVSIRLLYCNIRNKFGKIENKYNHTLIKTLISRNNKAYLQR